VAWSEHAFETAFLSVSVAVAAGFVVGAGCAKVALEPIRTANADDIKAFGNLIATSPRSGASRPWMRPQLSDPNTIVQRPI
jgi:hypothetical protein